MNGTFSLRILLTLAVVLLISASAAAQFGSLSGPVLGYVVDSNTSSVRPVKGILGSATIGDRLDTGVGPASMVTLDSGHAISATNDGIEILTLNLDAARIARLPVPGPSGNPSRVSVSLQATAAAFYYSGSNQIQVVSGLPREPRYVGIFQTNAAVSQMAVSDDGTLVVYAVASGDGASVYGWTAAFEGTRFLTTAISVSGIALTPRGDAIVTDRGANEVFAIWDAGGGAVRRLLAGVDEGVSEPMAVAVSSANRIYFVNAGSGNVVVLDSNGRYLKSHSCNCNPMGLFPIRDSVFRLTDRIDQTIFLLDASATEERIVFVPPPLE
jgi:WD40 repeat protein